MISRRSLLLGSALARAQAFSPGTVRIIDGIRLRWCPPGSFRMGSPANESGHRPDEQQADVTITQGFWIGETEVTQSQWTRVVGPLPKPADKGAGANVPVYWVNYADCENFCRRLTAQAGAGWECRLPTEAQWEYACRAGTTTPFSSGDSLSHADANYDKQHGIALDVASYPANPWGIHDMHGNVFEWCRDWYHDRLPGGRDPDLSTQKGTANRDGTYSRVRRGGAWNDSATFLRSALRLRYEPERSSDHIGFRIACIRIKESA